MSDQSDPTSFGGPVPPSGPPPAPSWQPAPPPSSPTVPPVPPVVSDGGWAPSSPMPAVPTPPPGSAATATAPKKSGVGLLLGGLVLIVIGLVAGAVMLVVAGGMTATAVEDLARAPMGCDTELEVAETGVYYFYVETKGEIGELDGTCSNTDHDYEFDDAPRVTLTLTDEDGEIVDLDRTSGIDYDTGDFAGTAVRTIELEDGTYSLFVDSREEDVVVAVGRDVTGEGGTLGALGLIVAVVGLLLGVVLVVLGLRGRRRNRGSGTPAPAPTPQAWTPTAPTQPSWSHGGPVNSPPTAPPPAAPPTGGGWQPPSPLS